METPSSSHLLNEPNAAANEIDAFTTQMSAPFEPTVATPAPDIRGTASFNPEPAVSQEAIATSDSPRGEISDEAEEKIAEAEGVLQQELAALMKSPVEMSSSYTSTSLLPTDSPSPPVEPSTMTYVHIEAPEGIRSSAPLVVPHNHASPSPGVAATVKSASKPSKIVQDVALMIAQLIDMPFSWVREIDKHVIGIAAFLMLLSGVALYVVAWFLGTH